MKIKPLEPLDDKIMYKIYLNVGSKMLNIFWKDEHFFKKDNLKFLNWQKILNFQFLEFYLKFWNENLIVSLTQNKEKRCRKH